MKRTMMLAVAVCASAAIAVGGFSLPQEAAAGDYIGVHVRIESSDPPATEFSDTVYISDDGCTVEDSAGTSHVLEGANALCALHAASLQKGFDYELTHYDGLGLLLSSIEDYEGDYSNYWLYYVNYQSAAVGMADYLLNEGDELILTYGGSNPPLKLTLEKSFIHVGKTIKAEVEYYSYDWITGTGSYLPVEDAHVNVNGANIKTNSKGHAYLEPAQTGTYQVYVTSDGYIRSGKETLRVYPVVRTYHGLGQAERQNNIRKGLYYLKQQIGENGTINDSQALTDWAAMAFAASGKEHEKLFTAAKKYNPKVADGASELARHILVLEALGRDASNYHGRNYIRRLKQTFSKGQFGSSYYCNDDIFATLALIAADERETSKYLKKGAKAARDCMSGDGGVSFAVGGASDIDTTAAWLMMSGRLKGTGVGTSAKMKANRRAAVNYVEGHQRPDGGWGYSASSPSNSSSTSWVLQGLRAQRQRATETRRNNLHGIHFLDSVQEPKGSFMYDLLGTQSSEVLNTAYAVMAFNKRPLPVDVNAPLDR